MRAAKLVEYGEPLQIDEVDVPTIGPEDVLVNVEACGICRSDWHAWQGDYAWLEGGAVPLGSILGHEPAGTVVEVGPDVTRFQSGDEVVLPFNIACGDCYFCRDGQSHMCENIRAYGFADSVSGAFATKVRVPKADFNLVHMPPGRTPTEMAALGCRYVTSFHAMAHRSGVSAGDWVAVHGCGGIGLSAVDVASALGANVVAVDLQEDKLAMAEEFGAVELINASETREVAQAVRDVTGGGAQISIDALGIQETCTNSIESVARTGRHIQIGITTSEEAGDVHIPIDYMLHNEIDLFTAKGMPPHKYGQIFDMMKHGVLHPEQLVTREVALDDVSDRLAAMTDFETRGVEVITSF